MRSFQMLNRLFYIRPAGAGNSPPSPSDDGLRARSRAVGSPSIRGVRVSPISQHRGDKRAFMFSSTGDAFKQLGPLGKKCSFIPPQESRAEKSAHSSHHDGCPSSSFALYTDLVLEWVSWRTPQVAREDRVTEFVGLRMLRRVSNLTSGNISVSARQEMRQEERTDKNNVETLPDRN